MEMKAAEMKMRNQRWPLKSLMSWAGYQRETTVRNSWNDGIFSLQKWKALLKWEADPQFKEHRMFFWGNWKCRNHHHQHKGILLVDLWEWQCKSKRGNKVNKFDHLTDGIRFSNLRIFELSKLNAIANTSTRVIKEKGNFLLINIHKKSVRWLSGLRILTFLKIKFGFIPLDARA